MKVILASGSPRRLELLKQIGLDVIVSPADFTEISGEAREARQVALANAIGKCREAVKANGDELPVIAADTIVVIDNKILGKPLDAGDASKMLAELSGRRHQVMTGVAVGYHGEIYSELCSTDVFFREIGTEEIADYIATGEPLDKAGAYGIQGRGAIFAEKINGCYNNVVGLPLAMLDKILRSIGARKI